MKKTLLVLPVLLLAGCASDLSIGQIGFPEGLALFGAAGFLVMAVLLKLGLVKPGRMWGYSALSYALTGLGMLTWAVIDIVSGLPEAAEGVLTVLGIILFLGGAVVHNRARKKKADNPK